MIAAELKKLYNEIPQGVTLVAVSKFHPAEAIREAYDAGQRCFGESRVQELLAKIPELPSDINWHFIGHLQTNKVKQIIGKVSLIESVDSERLLDLIDKESKSAGVTTRVLMQVHVAKEETKFGFLPEELLDYFNSRKFEKLEATHICGIMGMASNTDDEERVRHDFAEIYSLYKTIGNNESLGLRGFDIVSMGMSGDWKIAVEEGSDMVRIGTRIFGSRNY
ncbi:MAG: YggS family pyridoxal phosphate-dependent enzyme [Bacteroidales bacterium]|nr:YggS family pyridoxal phosphate-dependent enzyme [Bacteroidales bacterium]MBD5205453.1 YggS family pyridoxal phosphate-dependent enzyme [Bacteroidales bacterium]MBD5222860.1 YggS family pyridoxal phosphate-dependent enzyme [Bacteroidales bacterium]